MRRIILASLLVLAANWVAAQEQKTPPYQEPKSTTQAAAPAKDTKQMTVLVISTDPVAKTITVKKDADPMLSGTEREKTLAVDAKALTSLKAVTVGERVKISVKADASGKETVTTIEKSSAAAPQKQPEKQ